MAFMAAAMLQNPKVGGFQVKRLCSAFALVFRRCGVAPQLDKITVDVYPVVRLTGQSCARIIGRLGLSLCGWFVVNRVWWG